MLSFKGLQCPSCKNKLINLGEKLFLRPGEEIQCSKCKKKYSVSYLIHFLLFVPVIVFFVYILPNYNNLILSTGIFAIIYFGILIIVELFWFNFKRKNREDVNI